VDTCGEHGARRAIEETTREGKWKEMIGLIRSLDTM
jgi:hypothetical protein